MLAMCFSTAPPETTSAVAIPALDRPSAISASTSRSRGVRDDMPSVVRLAASSWLTTSGSRAVPPDPTRSSASLNSATSDTRSLSRYPIPVAPDSSSRDAYLVSMYCENTRTPIPGYRSRIVSAARRPSSVCDGGIRTSVTATSGRCSATAATSASPSPTAAAISWPLSVSSLISPSRSRAASSAITTLTTAPAISPSPRSARPAGWTP
jgi:hypothetical protein